MAVQAHKAGLVSWSELWGDPGTNVVAALHQYSLMGWAALDGARGLSATARGARIRGAYFRFKDVAPSVTQKQNRHIKGRPEWQRSKGGYFNSTDDAQAVLNAARNGKAEVLGTNSQGQSIVRYNGVTGFNNNPGSGFSDQPTNVFIIKGTQNPSVVPTNPNWGN